jgi:undecaprenyl-diphosphatase
MDLREPHPPSLSPRALDAAGWIAFLLAGGIFLAIAWSVTTRTPLVTLDAKMAAWLHSHGSPALTTFMVWVTQANSTLGIGLMSVVFAIVLARLREWYWLLTLALAVAGGMLVNVALKHTYERARPHFDDPMVTLSSYSFPSGHTAGAVVFYGTLAAFLVSRYYDTRKRAAIIAGAILAILLVAFSRMYLGAHYLSDVVAAAASSTAWLVLCLHTVHGVVRRRIAAAARAKERR